jgi:hypothetical protein
MPFVLQEKLGVAEKQVFGLKVRHAREGRDSIPYLLADSCPPTAPNIASLPSPTLPSPPGPTICFYPSSPVIR